MDRHRLWPYDCSSAGSPTIARTIRWKPLPDHLGLVRRLKTVRPSIVRAQETDPALGQGV